MGIRKNNSYGVVDLVKYMGAWLVVCSHYISENAVGRINPAIDYFSSLYIVVVPFFFTCSGFFLFTKVLIEKDIVNRERVILSFLKKNLRLYLVWSIIYFMFVLATWIKFGTTIQTIRRYFINAICYSTYKTIWFIPALCVGVIVTFYLYEKKSGRLLWIVGFCYFIGALGESYSFLMTEDSLLSKFLVVYKSIFVSTRNGLFNAFPFVSLGLLLAQESRPEREKRIKSDVKTCVIFGLCFLVEAFILKMVFDASNVNTLFFLLPFTYYFVKLCTNLSVESSRLLKGMRKRSTHIFLCQRLFLTALPTLFPEGIIAIVLGSNPYFALGVLFFVISVCAELLEIITTRNLFRRK